jgi:hypothetical protein
MTEKESGAGRIFRIRDLFRDKEDNCAKVVLEP